MRLNRIALIAISLFASCVASSARGDYAITVNDQGTVGFNGNWTLGYEFTPLADITITHLGYFDRGFDGLAQAHAIGLWDSGGALLSFAFVFPGSALDGSYRYSAIANFDLFGGNNYVIGTYDFTPDEAVRSDLGGIDLTVSPDIAIVSGRWIAGPAFPTNITNPFYYPVTAFQYFVTVPEPASTGIAIIAIFAVVSNRKRRQSA